MIADIREWLAKKEPAGKLVTGIVTGGDYARVFDHFAADFFRSKTQEVLPLGKQILAALRAQYGATSSELYSRDGFGVVRRLMSSVRPPESPVGRSWLEEEIRLSVPVSMTLTTDILGTWVSPSSPLTSPDDRPDLYRLAEQLAREQWHSGTALLEILHPSMHFDVGRFVRRLVHVDHGTPPFMLEELAWLGNVLVEALSINPNCVAPKIGYLVSEQLHGPDPADWIHQLQVERLFPLFGNDSRAVLVALSAYAEVAAGAEKVIMSQIATTGWSEFNEAVERCLRD